MFLYDGAMKDLGTFGGDISEAFSIQSELGHVAGYALIKSGEMHAFVSDGASCFGTSARSAAPSRKRNAINAAGQVTGCSAWPAGAAGAPSTWTTSLAAL